MSKSFLKIENLSVSISGEKPLVNGVSLTLQKGETLALVGESGSGKSLTALSIMRLLPQQLKVNKDTNILFEGNLLSEFSEGEMRDIRGSDIAMVFQESLVALNPVLTIEEQITEVLRCHFDLNLSEIHSRVINLLDEVGIVDSHRVANSYAHQLSGGQRQRALIAMALAGKPKLLIADEPTTALDVTTQAKLLKLLKSLQQKYKMALIFITHDLYLVQKIADKVGVMCDGKLVEIGKVERIFEKPKSKYTQKLLSMVPGKVKMDSVVDSDSSVLLEVSDLKVYFPIRKGVFKRVVDHFKAVDGISFTLKKAETLAIVGESGSGKTTAARAVLRLIDANSGFINFDGVDLLAIKGGNLRSIRRNIQIVFQDPFSSLNPRMMVLDIIAEGLRAQGLVTSETALHKEVMQLLSLVELSRDSLWRYPHEFSGGQRQRIAIARALALKPKLLICDEPTSELDWSVQMQVMRLLKKLQHEKQISYLLITHDLAVVSEMAHRVIVVKDGKMVESGFTADVLQSPKDNYTKQLMGARFDPVQ